MWSFNALNMFSGTQLLEFFTFFFLHFENIHATLLVHSVSVARTTPVVTIRAQSVASHLETCRSVTRYFLSYQFIYFHANNILLQTHRFWKNLHLLFNWL